MKTRTCNRACSMLRQIPLLQPSLQPSHSVRISRWAAGNAGIDSDADDSQPTEKRHRNLNSYFSDEEDDGSSPSGGEEVEQETQDSEGCNSEEELPLDTFFLPPLSDSRFFLRHKEGYKKPAPTQAGGDEPTHGINTNSDLFWTLHNPTEETSTKVRGAICKAYREVKDPMDPNKWVTITDHLDSCGAFDLVQRQYVWKTNPELSNHTTTRKKHSTTSPPAK